MAKWIFSENSGFKIVKLFVRLRDERSVFLVGHRSLFLLSLLFFVLLFFLRQFFLAFFVRIIWFRQESLLEL